MPLFSTHVSLIIGLDIEFCVGNYYPLWRWRHWSIVSGFCIVLWEIWGILIADLLFMYFPVFPLNLWKLLGTSCPEWSEIANMQLYYFIHYVGINRTLHHEHVCVLFEHVCFFVWSFTFFIYLWSLSFWNSYYSNIRSTGLLSSFLIFFTIHLLYFVLFSENP